MSWRRRHGVTAAQRAALTREGFFDRERARQDALRAAMLRDFRKVSLPDVDDDRPLDTGRLYAEPIDTVADLLQQGCWAGDDDE